PTFLISSLARRHVTVSLSGDGGDELLAGYNRYLLDSQLLRTVLRSPLALRRVIGFVLQTFAPSTWDRVFHCVSGPGSSASGQRHLGDKVHRLGRIIARESVDDAYITLMS